MDSLKLNLEFTKLQKAVENYNKIINSINMKIKDNLHIISKYEAKTKNINNILENDLSYLYIISLKCNNEFLESLVKESENNESESRNIKSI